MSRNRSIKIARINIVTHPHTEDGYINLMRMAFLTGRSISIRGDQHLMIGEMRYLDSEHPKKGVFGRLYRFVQIDKNASWFNVEKKDIATDEELAEINIPEHLRPNCEMFDFVFYPNGHAFYLESKSGNHSLSPSFAAKMLKALFSSPEITKIFGEVEVNVFSDKEHLEKILNIHELRRLIIEVSKPNPDELGRAQAKVFNRLDKLKAKKIKMEITAEKRASIKVDDELKTAARVAAAGNGKVVGYGYAKNGDRIEDSTLAKPWENTVAYNPDLQTQTDALIAATTSLPGHN